MRELVYYSPYIIYTYPEIYGYDRDLFTPRL